MLRKLFLSSVCMIPDSQVRKVYKLPLSFFEDAFKNGYVALVDTKLIEGLKEPLAIIFEDNISIAFAINIEDYIADLEPYFENNHFLLTQLNKMQKNNTFENFLDLLLNYSKVLCGTKDYKAVSKISYDFYNKVIEYVPVDGLRSLLYAGFVTKFNSI
ncbi:MAG: hypothetical protein RR922_01065 [Clostridia bacterium]